MPYYMRPKRMIPLTTRIRTTAFDSRPNLVKAFLGLKDQQHFCCVGTHRRMGPNPPRGTSPNATSVPCQLPKNPPRLYSLVKQFSQPTPEFLPPDVNLPRMGGCWASKGAITALLVYGNCVCLHLIM